MSKDNDIDDESRSLFRSAVTGSRRLRHDKIKPYRRRLKAVPIQRQLDEAAVLQDALIAPESDYELECGEQLLFSRNGVQNQVMRKLRRGQYAIEAELDLHRYTTQQAHEALQLFLRQCRLRHLRCVRIIHGKGLGSKDKRPVLKGKVNHWLQQRDDILAFSSARPIDGGTGAIYVLLRR